MAAILNLIDVLAPDGVTYTQRLGINKGEDYNLIVTLYQDAEHTLPLDLTGYGARASLKVNANDATASQVIRGVVSVNGYFE